MFFLQNSRTSVKVVLIFFLLLIISVPLFFLVKHTAVRADDAGTHHYLYVVPDDGLYVYDMDNNFALVKHITLSVPGGRGIAVDPASGSLFFSYYNSTVATQRGWLLKYDLVHDTVVWNKQLPFSVDSPALTPDGKELYMPESQAAFSGAWHIFSTADGSLLGTIDTGVSGAASHNTVISLNGTHAYLGGINYNYLIQVSTATHQVTQTMGPLKSGVRPFTINGKETLAFTTATGILGFEVSDITTGKVLYTVPVQGFTSTNALPSHGISLSPDEKEIYVMDVANSMVHVFDVSGLPATAPQQVADIPLRSMAGNENNCTVDCQKEGWLLHSLDGRYVFVGDSGDVVDTATRKSIANLPALFDSRKYIEVDFSNGVPIATTTRHGLGRVTDNNGTPIPTTPTPTSTDTTPTPTPTPPDITPTPTTAPGLTLAQDTFQRADQAAYWGTASDGQNWGGDANVATAFSIAQNAGLVTGNSSTSYNAILGPSVSNSEALASGSISAFGSTNFGVVLRWANTNTWYKAYIDGSSVYLQRRLNGAVTVLTSASFHATAGTAYSIRFRAVGTTLSMKVWPTNTTEPTDWTLTTDDTLLTSGFAGLRITLLPGIQATFTSFQETSL